MITVYTSSRKRKNIIIVILTVILVGMTIGYSALSSYLTINGTSNITSDFKVVFTSIEEGTMNSATTVNKSYEGTSATFQVKLDKPGSNAEYIVTVQNQGKLDAYLESIQCLDETNEKSPTYITFSVKDLRVNEKLGIGESKTFKVIVSYNMSATEILEESKQLTLTLNYSQDTGTTLPDVVGTFEEPVIKDGLIPVTYDAEGNTVKANGTQNGEWLTHPAFTFGGEEIPGFWFGKFEMTGTGSNPTIKPNLKSLTNQNMATQFNTI